MADRTQIATTRWRTLRFPVVIWILGVSLLPVSIVSAQLSIAELSPSDPVYQQHQELVAQYHRARAQDGTLPPLLVLTYTPAEGETLFDISSRLMLPYATLATLNRLDDTRIDRRRTILVPTQPGLFTYEEPKNRLEELIVERLDTTGPGTRIVVPGAAEGVAFYDGADFSSDERRLFLQITFDDPLEIGVLSSQYGYRNHPITGVWSHHNGIDLAADFGTPVRTAAEGRVSSITRDPWLGLSITIDHADEYQTRYAHLQESFVAVGTIVERGATIGTVGSTGLSTGPHLHFEILYRGENRDPVRFLPRELQ